MNSADIIFIGNIITVDDSNPTVEALAVKNGKIVAVGSQEAVLQWKGEGTEIIDLEDKTLMPGFIEPHSHPIMSALLYDFIDVSGFNN
ncbi:MAG: amidohydrolase, partial [Promethearchaeota archaeon]